MDKLNVTKARDRCGVFYHLHPDIYSVYQNKDTKHFYKQLQIKAENEDEALKNLISMLDDYVSVVDDVYMRDNG